MRAVVIHGYGPPECLHVEDIARPEPKPEQVIIKVHAAGLNPIDWRIRNGSLRFIFPATFPLILGFDVSGVIERVGEGVEHWKTGDEVIAYLDDPHGGGYAEYAAAAQHVVARKPSSIPHVEAASLPLAGSTALQALRDIGDIQDGSRVLINGASGGVGTFAVQLASYFGAQVTAVCGPDNVLFVRNLGADTVIDYREGDFTRERVQYDIVFDAVATSSFLACRRVLAPRGRYVTTVPSPTNLVSEAVTRLTRRRHCKNMLVQRRGSDLQFLAGLVDDGVLRPILADVLPLADAARAHQISQGHHARGKLVLQVCG